MICKYDGFTKGTIFTNRLSEIYEKVYIYILYSHNRQTDLQDLNISSKKDLKPWSTLVT